MPFIAGIAGGAGIGGAANFGIGVVAPAEAAGCIALAAPSAWPPFIANSRIRDASRIRVNSLGPAGVPAAAGAGAGETTGGTGAGAQLGGAAGAGAAEDSLSD